MTDDISKVVEARQIIDEFIQCTNVGRWDGKLVNAAKDWLAATDRLESATTPAEVEAVAWFIDDGTTKSFTTRQIDADLWGKEPGYTITPLVPAAAVATLARQLAEQRDYADKAAQRVIAAEIKQKAAESQLAEATRRLGEVEGLVGKWRGIAHEYRYNPAAMPRTAHHYEACADDLKAAITKEPPHGNG